MYIGTRASSIAGCNKVAHDECTLNIKIPALLLLLLSLCVCVSLSLCVCVCVCVCSKRSYVCNNYRTEYIIFISFNKSKEKMLSNFHNRVNTVNLLHNQYSYMKIYLMLDFIFAGVQCKAFRLWSCKGGPHG